MATAAAAIAIEAMLSLPTTTATTTATPIVDTSPSPPLCKHCSRAKSCMYHSKGKCKFSHPADYEVIPPKLTQQQQKRQRPAKQQNQQTTNLHNRHRSANGWLQTRNDARVAIFRAFIASAHTRHTTSSSSDSDTRTDTTIKLDLANCNVLDVAGGKGELAFQLLNLNNVQTCHVIDPRPLSLKRFQKRLIRGFYHRSMDIIHTDVVRPQSDPERPVTQLRCLFSNELWEQEQDKESDDNNNINSNNNKAAESAVAAIQNNNKGNNNNNENESDHHQQQRNQFFKNCYKAQGWM